MKKIYRLLLLALVLACLFATAAFASDYDDVAQELKTLGLFQGTQAGFDLDRAPTRTEAAVMLVRLLGTENVAKTEYSAGTTSNPFTDVPDWAKPYISWLYTNNLAKGVSDTVFGANGQCTAKMYCTFVLRALGYNDTEGDFTFDEAEDLAEYLGFYDTYMVEDTFLRDHAVAISYRALAASLNGTDTSLLEKLVKDGAVTQTSASALLTKIKNYRDYIAVYDKFNSFTAGASTTNRSFLLTNTKNSGSFTGSVQNSYKYIATSNDFQMEFISNFNDGSTTSTIGEWIKDGYYYYKNDTEKTKEELTESLMDSMFSSGPSSLMPALYQVKSITVSQTFAGTQYVMTYADDFDYLSLSNSYWSLGLDPSKVMNHSISKCNFTIVVGGGGIISSFKKEYACTFLYNSEGSIMPLSLTDTSEEIINATGSGVYINFPDFSGFTEVS
ncbi:MAG: hypothetical protein CVU91_03550 [Firmicutes bacterium HGW-Firmicutes-16]|nr:MAG: hypothetical protein CVU91_03550 [Firmicutes bacterium HGW-Firmicutes-16]